MVENEMSALAQVLIKLLRVGEELLSAEPLRLSVLGSAPG